MCIHTYTFLYVYAYTHTLTHIPAVELKDSFAKFSNDFLSRLEEFALLV